MTDSRERGHFADRLFAAVEERRSHVVVGLDPNYALLPPDLPRSFGGRGEEGGPEDRVDAFREFLEHLLPVIADAAVAVKPQLAYFEALGAPGYALYEEVVRRARDEDLLVIADAKRGDIGSTAAAYAEGHLGPAGADALTVNPWFGTDGLEPFLERARGDRGIFVLVKTSNPSSAELQDLTLADGGPVHHRVARLTAEWGRGTEGARGYRSVGAVVGGTHPGQLSELRRELPGVPLLIPGYGAQGAGPTDVAGAFDEEGTGAVVNSSRAILYAYRNRGGDWRQAARQELLDMRGALWKAAGRG